MTLSSKLPKSNSARIDPDPFTLVMLLLTVTSTAAGVYAARNARLSGRQQRKERVQKRRAAAHRWQANLIDFEVTLRELGELLEREGVGTNESGGREPLEPLTESMFFTSSGFRKYRQLTNRLTRHAKALNNDMFRLLPLVDDERLVMYLRETSHEIRTRLGQMKNASSVAAAIEQAMGTVAILKQTAAYLQETNL